MLAPPLPALSESRMLRRRHAMQAPTAKQRRHSVAYLLGGQIENPKRPQPAYSELLAQAHREAMGQHAENEWTVRANAQNSRSPPRARRRPGHRSANAPAP